MGDITETNPEYGIFNIFGHVVTLNFDLLTPNQMRSSLSPGALLTEVWLKSINAYHRYCGNNMTRARTHALTDDMKHSASGTA